MHNVHEILFLFVIKDKGIIKSKSFNHNFRLTDNNPNFANLIQLINLQNNVTVTASSFCHWSRWRHLSYKTIWQNCVINSRHLDGNIPTAQTNGVNNNSNGTSDLEVCITTFYDISDFKVWSQWLLKNRLNLFKICSEDIIIMLKSILSPGSTWGDMLLKLIFFYFKLTIVSFLYFSFKWSCVLFNI